MLFYEAHTGHSVFAGCLHGVAQVALGQPRVLTHDGVGAAAFAVGDGIEHLPVLVLRHHPQVTRPRTVGLSQHKA